MEQIRLTDLDAPQQSEAMLALISQCEGADIKLDSQSLLAAAQAQLDVEIDIDDGLLDRFVTLFEEVLSNAPVHAAGRFILQTMAVNGIVHSSRMRAIRRDNPSISRIDLSPPLVVAGMPRSGTTYLLQLLATDPTLLSLQRWECMQPFPSKGVLNGQAPDLRQEEGSAALKLNDDIVPFQKYLYDVDPEETTEEIEAMIHGAYGVGLSFMGDVPNYDHAFYSNDQTAAYQYLRDMLQTQNWLRKARPDQKWLLKSPQHMGALDAIDNVFPDATLVFTHRDPASVFTSLITLIGYTARRTCSSMSKQQLIDRAMRMQHGFLRGVVKHASRFENRSVHIYFQDFMKDYKATVADIYMKAGLQYDDSAREQIERQASGYLRGRKGARLVYDLEADFGLSRDDIRKEFSYYLDHFPVSIEEVQQ